MPGLLRTTDYMRVSTNQLAPQMPPEQVDTVIEVRLKRQELLERTDAPLLHFVLDEAVIRRSVGGKDVMLGQLRQLIEAAGMPSITVEVIPFSAGLLPGLQAPFVIHCALPHGGSVTDAEPTGDVWRTSRASQPHNVLLFTHAGWRAFLAGARNGELDLPEEA